MKETDVRERAVSMPLACPAYARDLISSASSSIHYCPIGPTLVIITRAERIFR